MALAGAPPPPTASQALAPTPPPSRGLAGPGFPPGAPEPPRRRGTRVPASGLSFPKCSLTGGPQARCQQRHRDCPGFASSWVPAPFPSIKWASWSSELLRAGSQPVMTGLRALMSQMKGGQAPRPAQDRGSPAKQAPPSPQLWEVGSAGWAQRSARVAPERPQPGRCWVSDRQGQEEAPQGEAGSGPLQ